MPEARTAKEAEAKAEDDVEVRTVLLICHVCCIHGAKQQL